jgi:hypothetical protein
MPDDVSSATAFEKRRDWFLALAEKNRVRAATATNAELAHGYARLAIGYENLADGCEKLARLLSSMQSGRQAYAKRLPPVPPHAP